MMAADYDKPVADAKKILGKDAEIPMKRLQAMEKELDAVRKKSKEWGTAKETLEKHLVEFQDIILKYKDRVSQAEDELTSSDFSLDKNDADNKKKIQQAEAVFEKYFKDTTAEVDDDIKALKEVDKHLMNIAKYKGPS